MAENYHCMAFTSKIHEAGSHLCHVKYNIYSWKSRIYHYSKYELACFRLGFAEIKSQKSVKLKLISNSTVHKLLPNQSYNFSLKHRMPSTDYCTTPDASFKHPSSRISGFNTLQILLDHWVTSSLPRELPAAAVTAA